MDTYEGLREDFAAAFTAISDYAQAQRRHAEVVSAEVAALWADNAALRDELHALANRVETLTRARLTEPAETAEAMVARPWFECSECGTAIYRASNGLILDGAGLHTCRESERRIVAGAE